MQSPYYQNRNGYQPYNNKGDNPEVFLKTPKQFKYMLSLSRKHIAFFLFLMLSIFGMFFVLGLFTGFKVGKNSTLAGVPSISTNTEYAYDNYNNYDAVVLNNNLSNEAEVVGVDDLGFVSQSVTSSKTSGEKDVLEISGKSGIEPVEKSISKKSVTKPSTPSTLKSKVSKTADKSPSPYVRNPIPDVQYYYIQVIATEEVERAQKIYGELKKRNYPVHVKKSAKDEKMLYAIRVGLYKNRELANKHLRLIRKGGGYTSAFMKPYKVDKSTGDDSAMIETAEPNNVGESAEANTAFVNSTRDNGNNRTNQIITPPNNLVAREPIVTQQ